MACSAYRSGTRMEDERYGRVHDYSPRKGIQASGVFLPDTAPDWARCRERLWNKLEAFEKRKDAQLAREFVLGLPHQLGFDAQLNLLEKFVRQELIPHGLAADWAVHDANRAGDHRNTHAHIMVTLRGLDADGFHSTKDRSLNSTAQLQRWREVWAELQNEAFREHGVFDQQGEYLAVDHRSYDARGISRLPTHHMGVHATAMERRGKPTEIGELNRQIRSANDNGASAITSPSLAEDFLDIIARQQSRRSSAEVRRMLSDQSRDNEPGA